MKTELTIDESAHLIELGVDPKLASEVMINYIDPYDIDDAIERKNPIYSLTDILSILPKEINYNGLTSGLSIWVEYGEWYVKYISVHIGYDYLNHSDYESPELIDTLYQLLVWCIENGHYNPKNKKS